MAGTLIAEQSQPHREWRTIKSIPRKSCNSEISVMPLETSLDLQTLSSEDFDQPRPEYPRPQFSRAEWKNLNGPWEFDFDDADVGLRDAWYSGLRGFSRKILVPFTFEANCSGIGDPSFHERVWYRRELGVPNGWSGKRVREFRCGRLPGDGMGKRPW